MANRPPPSFRNNQPPDPPGSFQPSTESRLCEGTMTSSQPCLTLSDSAGRPCVGDTTSPVRLPCVDDTTSPVRLPCVGDTTSPVRLPSNLQIDTSGVPQQRRIRSDALESQYGINPVGYPSQYSTSGVTSAQQSLTRLDSAGSIVMGASPVGDTQPTTMVEFIEILRGQIGQASTEALQTLDTLSSVAFDREDRLQDALYDVNKFKDKTERLQRQLNIAGQSRLRPEAGSSTAGVPPNSNDHLQRKLENMTRERDDLRQQLANQQPELNSLSNCPDLERPDDASKITDLEKQLKNGASKIANLEEQVKEAQAAKEDMSQEYLKLAGQWFDLRYHPEQNSSGASNNPLALERALRVGKQLPPSGRPKPHAGKLWEKDEDDGKKGASLNDGLWVSDKQFQTPASSITPTSAQQVSRLKRGSRSPERSEPSKRHQTGAIPAHLKNAAATLGNELSKSQQVELPGSQIPRGPTSLSEAGANQVQSTSSAKLEAEASLTPIIDPERPMAQLRARQRWNAGLDLFLDKLPKTPASQPPSPPQRGGRGGRPYSRYGRTWRGK